MRVTWMGHGSFRIEAGGQVLLLDPWITDNPVFPAEKADEIVAGDGPNCTRRKQFHARIRDVYNPILKRVTLHREIK